VELYHRMLPVAAVFDEVRNEREDRRWR